MNVLVIDYEMGNVQSVANAFKAIGCSASISNDKKEFSKASHLVLPGVGAFEQGMDNLTRLGIIDILKDEVMKKGKPFLGICLGMQLLFNRSHENGTRKGLGWIDGEVVGFDPEKVLVPHVGWNDVYPTQKRSLFNGIEDNLTFYFVHSFFPRCDDKDLISATSEYGERFVAAIEKDNIFATQFHPEKSQVEGLEVLKNFVEWSQPDA
ncbi:imidazole glycerol phosphate synthase subunit HisH [Candidatus Omnitrophota bacterium]